MSFGVIAASVAVASAAAGTYFSVQGQRAAAQGAEAAAKGAQMSAEWNADQARKQAKFEESTAQENMRRKRENNKREIARRRAMGGRSGLKETGAVGDMLLDTSERLQQDVDDIWRTASTRSTQLRGEANMSIWEGQQAMAASKYASKASKYAIYGSIAKGVGAVASAGMKMKGSLGGAKGIDVSGAPKAYTIDGSYK